MSLPPPAAWATTWGLACESGVESAWKCLSNALEHNHASCTPTYRVLGRHRLQAPRLITTPPAPRRRGSVALRKAVRTMQRCRHLLERHPSPTQRQGLERSLVRAHSRYAASLPSVPSFLIGDGLRWITSYVETLRRQEQDSRLQDWRQRAAHGASSVTTVARALRVPPATSCGDTALSVRDVPDVLASLASDWTDVWTFPDSAVEIDPFLPSFSSMPPPPPLSLRDLRAATRRLGTSAAGPDGWTPADLRHAPDWVLVALLEFFRLVHSQCAWPRSLVATRTVFLEKPGQIGQYRPITVASVVVRMYFSASVSLCRAQLAALPPSLVGGLPERLPSMMPAELAACAQQYHARLSSTTPADEHLASVSLDLSKCFDRVSRRQAQRAIAVTLCSPMLASTWFAFMQQHCRFFTLSTVALPHAVPAPNGLIQGDPVAVAVVAVLMSAWLSQLESKLPTLRLCHSLADPFDSATVFFKCYVDDRHLLIAQRHVPQVLQCVASLDDAWGWRLQKSKTEIATRLPPLPSVSLLDPGV